MKEILIGIFCTIVSIEAGFLDIISGNEARIVGGEPTDIENFPHQLSVRFYGFHICGASIISENFALSLASCLEFKFPEQITLLAGATDISSESNGLSAKASKFIFHPNFDWETNAFDIVVIEVRTPFIGENIEPVKLSTQGMPMYEGLQADFAGWGNNQDPTSAYILHKVKLPIVEFEKCSKAWNHQIPETAICAGQIGYDTCSSDNGGALVYCGLQIGINIKNSESCDGSKPAVFTNIAHPDIRSFIRKQTGV